MFGTGAMIMLDETACLVRASEVIARFYDHESCGQCSQCREGTQWLHQIFHRIENGLGTMSDIDNLDSLARGMAPGKTICALSDAAAIPVQSLIKHFRGELEEHVVLGAEHEGRRLLRVGAHLGCRRAHEEHPLVAQRLGGQPADGAAAVADLGPALDADQHLHRHLAPVDEQGLRLGGGRVVQHCRRVDRGAEVRRQGRQRHDRGCQGGPAERSGRPDAQFATAGACCES